MPVFIVDGLHIVQIDEKNLDAAFGGQEIVIELLAEAGKPETVVKPGQRVMDIQIIQGIVQGLQEALFPHIFKGNLQEVEDAFMQVQFCSGADSVQRDIADGIGTVVQRVEHQEMFPLHDGVRKKL